MKEASDSKTNGNIWIRLLYMVLFMMIFGIAEFVLYLTAVVGVVFSLFGKPINIRVRNIGHSIGLYIKQIADYLSFYTDVAPFPFDNWPDDTVNEAINSNFD